MASFKIEYRLSSDGQRASLIAGGDGKAVQFLTIDHTHPAFPALLAIASVSNDGTASLDTNTPMSDGGQTVPQTSWDALPAVEQILADQVARRERLAALIVAARAEKTTETLAVLAARETSGSIQHVGSLQFSFISPAWPYQADESVTASPEALAWLTEIDAANAVTQAEMGTAVEAKRLTDAAAEQAKQDAAAAKEVVRAAWREANGLRDGDEVYRIEDGCLAGVPNGMHSGDKLWMAMITVSPSSPGGLGRDFAKRARGDLHYFVPNLSPGDAIEFGADEVSRRGRKTRNRWYGWYVRTLTSVGTSPAGHPEGTQYLVLRSEPIGKAAIKAGQKFAEKLATA